MKTSYKRPMLLEYGRLDQLTLGGTGTLPDYVGGVLIDTCPTATEVLGGSTLTRTSCSSVIGGPIGS